MRELFDYLDAADPWAMLAAAFALLYLLEVATSMLRKRAHLYECAAERIAGYSHGLEDGRARGVPAYRERITSDVPEAFAKAYRR